MKLRVDGTLCAANHPPLEEPAPWLGSSAEEGVASGWPLS